MAFHIEMTLKAFEKLFFLCIQWCHIYWLVITRSSLSSRMFCRKWRWWAVCDWLHLTEFHKFLYFMCIVYAWKQFNNITFCRIYYNIMWIIIRICIFKITLWRGTFNGKKEKNPQQQQQKNSGTRAKVWRNNQRKTEKIARFWISKSGTPCLL